MSVTTGHTQHIKTWFSDWQISSPRISHKMARALQIVCATGRPDWGGSTDTTVDGSYCAGSNCLLISFSEWHFTAKHQGGSERLELRADRKTNEDILTKIKTQSVFVQTNSRNSGQSDIVKC
jgi:hypothetical protein